VRKILSRSRFNAPHFPPFDSPEHLEHLRHQGMEHGVRVPSGHKNENREGQSTEVLLIGEVLISGDQHLILPSSRPQKWTVLQTFQPASSTVETVWPTKSRLSRRVTHSSSSTRIIGEQLFFGSFQHSQCLFTRDSGELVKKLIQAFPTR
jgi:hypothetical protein